MQNLTTKTAIIQTDKGNIKLEFYPAAAPKTVANFVDLINEGFYNGLIFHRVVPGFIIQGGDPKGDGTGGPGYTFADEINPWSVGLSEDEIKSLELEGYKYTRNVNSYKMIAGALAMANAGPNTNGSQFFIVTEQSQPHLDGRHTVFGRVIEGMEVVRQIQQGDIIKEIKIVK
ncbi:peptidylprolyl isomerase [Patescibacteria group bacterium]|nr:peptidylprolyl isomerase [Patescibacteria group bacterium]